MDHTDALRLQAAEKYLLNELTDAERGEYENHCFDCPACSEDLKATATFMDASRQLFREGEFAPKVARPEPAREHSRQTDGWFAWLKPAFAVPVFAALLLVIGYQNGITIPRLKQGASSSPVAEVVKSVQFPPVGSRGEGSPSILVSVRPRQDILLEADMPGNSDDGYLCEIQDQSGRVLASVPVTPTQAKNTVPIKVAGGVLTPGNYKLVIRKGENPSSSEDQANPPSSVRFTVEFLP